MEENQQSHTLRIKDTTATKKVFALRKRIRAVAGGTSASKTISILIWLIDYCQALDKNGKPLNENKLCTVTSESYPHLEKGAMLDFENIMKDRGYWNEDRWNKTKHQYTFETDNVLEFAIFDTYNKAHGPRRDVLFVNEGNNLPFNIVDQLITRTREIIWLDWNPTSEFWFYTEMLPHRTDIEFITLTYKDNEALDEESVREIEMHKYNKNWWKVYGLGELGDVEGRIYTGWVGVDGIPEDAKLRRKGLDFGYTNDPSALIDVWQWNNGFIIDEILYRKGMSNKDLSDVILHGEQALTIADSAEPKSIDELASYGVSILPAQKGQGSVNQGIQYIQGLTIYVTNRSLNIWKEYKNYMWLTDKDGKIINEPQDFMNHCMDALRYALENLQPRNEATVTLTKHRNLRSISKWSIG